MIDINELRRLAQAATHPTTKGRWMRLFGERTVYDRMEDGCRGVPIVAADHHPPGPQAAAYLDFIAAANPAAITELLDRLEAAERERDELLEACETFVEWLGREESGFARAGNKRDTPEGERAWRDWYNENLRLCALAQEQARAAIARATGEQT